MNALLNCIGACASSLGCQRCLQSVDLDLMKNQIFHPAKKNEKDSLQISEPRYCSKVLLGNWFEERAETKYTPYKWITTYETVFKPPNKENFNITIEGKCFAKKNKGKNQGVGHEQLLGYDGGAYRGNFSTTYDLTYRILPSGLTGPVEKIYSARKDAYVPEQDLTQNFGSTVEYGLKEYCQLKAEESLNEAMDIPRSIYQCDFVRKTSPFDGKRYPLIRVDMNKPDLRHLDINAAKKWCHHHTSTYHRINLLQQRVGRLH